MTDPPLAERCLDIAGSLTRLDRQRRRVYSFTVPDGATRLRIEFRYAPGQVDGIHNLLTVAIFDRRGFRGAAHRWSQDQLIVIDAMSATPGFIAGDVPPGPWRVVLDAHEVVNDGSATGTCEFRLLAETTSDPIVTTEQRLADRSWRRPSTAIDAAPRWLRGDLHSHSTHCDGSSTVVEMALAAAAIGLDFLATTGHNTISQWRPENSWPTGLLQIMGIECTTYFGHANILGASAWVDWRIGAVEAGARSIAEQAHGQGAIAVINHPCAAGNPACTGCRWDFPQGDIVSFDAVEVWNGSWLASDVGNASALALWSNLLMSGDSVTAVAGTDAHSADEYLDHRLPYTWVYASALGEREIVAALRAGRAYLSCGPRLTFEAQDRLGRRATLPGDRLGPGRFDLAVEISGDLAGTALWLVTDGVSRPVGRPADMGGAIRTTATAEAWWRLELRNDDAHEELLAVTNPVLHSLT